jgi:hypothetical protein
MLTALRRLMVSPVTGPVATAVAVGLAAALGVSSAGWRAEQARYEARITALNRDLETRNAGLLAEVAACRAADVRRQALEVEFARRPGPPPGAGALLAEAPEGIDACARMESADRAVLQNLKR